MNSPVRNRTVPADRTRDSRRAGARRTAVRSRPAGLLGSLALTMLALSACTIVGPGGPGAPGPGTGQGQISVSPTTMNGVTSASVNVSASGSWTLGSNHPSWVSLSATSGSGPATVQLTVDPSSLAPGSYNILLSLQSDAGSSSAQIPFSFPDVTVTVTRGDTLTSQALPAAQTPPPNPALSRFGSGPGDLIVGVAKVPTGAPSIDMNAIAATPGVKVHGHFAGAGVVTVHAQNAAAAAARLRGLAGVRYVEASLPLHAFSNDPYRGQQWNLDAIRAEQAWPTGDGTGTTIAVIDRGFDPSHPDLAANVTGTYNAVTGTSNLMVSSSDCTAHGTHVAGIAAAVANNGTGIAGVAPGAGLLLVNIGDGSTSGCPMTTTALIDALDYVTDSGNPRARVINLSLGSQQDLGQGVQDALTAAYDAGVVIVAAAGNDQASQPTPVAYPAAYPEVLAVGATTPNDVIAFYSDRGPNLWVVAPGGGTSSGVGTTSDEILSTWYDFTNSAASYNYEEGTSMASPAAAGVAAQLLTSRPGASPDQIAQALANGALDLGVTGKDDVYGYGLIDAVASKQALASSSPLLLHTSDGRTFDVTRGVPFTVPNLPTGTVTLTAGTDDNNDGTIGDASGELYGQATVSVAFDSGTPLRRRFRDAAVTRESAAASPPGP